MLEPSFRSLLGMSVLLVLAGCASGNVISVENGECTHIVENGVYAWQIDRHSFPRGARVCARTDGGVVLTGSFNPGGYSMRGFVVVNSENKTLSDGVFERMSFVGGPACGNNVNTAIGSNTVIRDSVFFGPGGRYLLLGYRVVDVLIENAIFRADGGWGETESCSEFEPNAALAFYDSSNAVCRGCINFDQRSDAARNSESLGGLGVNAHSLDLCFAVRFENSIDVDGSFFWAAGNGRCNPEFDRVSGGFNLNLEGTTIIMDGSGPFCNTWRGQVEALSSNFASGNCASHARVNGPPELDLNFVDDPRWRREMCSTQSRRKDGWCGTDLPLSAYLIR